MPENTSNLDKAADFLADVNAVVAQFIPLVGPFMATLGAVLKLFKRPDVDPAVRRQLIDTMRTNFQTIGLNADDWLAQHGYDADGNKIEG